MSIAPSSALESDSAVPRRTGRRRAQAFQAANSLLAQGESMIWLTGGALVLCLTMILGLILFVVSQGGSTFWPMPLVRVATAQGEMIQGEVVRWESFSPNRAHLEAELPADQVNVAEKQLAESGGISRRRLIRTGISASQSAPNRWVSDFAVVSETLPEWGVVFERLTNGRLYGEPHGYWLKGVETTADSPAAAWAFYQEHRAEVQATLRNRRMLETQVLGTLNARLEAVRIQERAALLKYGIGSEPLAAATKYRQEKETRIRSESDEVVRQIEQLRADNLKYQLRVRLNDQQFETVPMEEIVRAYPANRLRLGEKWAVYVSRWWEFLSAEPRESNTEGGVLPAIFGTVAMTLIMSLAVAPFGVLAALYLREYARSGWIVSVIRIAINNLAGVPSIVFGVFGFGFFCCQVGTYLDGGPRLAKIPTLPPATWYLALAGLAAIGLLAFLASLGSSGVRAGEANRTQRWLGRAAVMLWLACTGLLVGLLATTPFFNGFFAAALPNPTFGTGGIMWSALTLALLTLPVVIVATEEALAAVPNSLREGSYACGGGKWQTIRRIVLPHAMPGILTGMILAMSRGAGEVAPLMLVGAIKFAPKLPFDGEFPFIHPERSFMHLAFHIFDLGFQSPDSEAAKPTVFTTILLLIIIVATLNIAAVWLRARLRKGAQHGQF